MTAYVSREDIKYAFHLEDMTEIEVAPFWNAEASSSDVTITLGATLKNPIDTVIKLVKK